MKTFLITSVVGFNYFVGCYYGIVNLFYTMLLTIATASILAYIRKIKYLPLRELQFSPEVPPVSIIIPAHNEGETLFRTILSALNVTYPDSEIIVINDGSTDGMLDRLIRKFNLRRIDLVYRSFLKTMPVRGFYYNKDIPNLIVVDKEQGGKSDALNCGINVCRSPYFCTIDADTMIESDALLRLMAAVMESTVPIIACGGVVRVSHGCTIEDNKVTVINLPKKWLGLFQIVEYLRGFLFGRVGLDNLKGNLVLSGAFSMFEKQAALEVGGFAVNNVCEDMEIIVRMHKHMRLKKAPYAIRFISDPICWTEVPSTIRAMGRQRRRWHLGLIQTMMRYNTMLFNPRYGKTGLLAMPYYFFVEMLSPVVEVVGYVSITVAYFFDMINYDFFMLFLILAIFYGAFLSVTGVFLEELTYRRYPKWQHLFTLLFFGILENFGYRQLNSLWRFQAFFQYLFGKQQWEYSRQRRGDAKREHIDGNIVRSFGTARP